LILGYPWDIARATNDNNVVVAPYLEWTEVLPDHSDPERLKYYDPDKHFLARFNQSDKFPQASPEGMSGAAMWFHAETTSPVWRPNLDIAGVAIAWYENSKLQQVVRREIVEGFLNSKLPG
jgi:hypothetical protein